MLGLRLDQRKIKVEDDHILAFAARHQPRKLQKLGNETLLGHQNLHAQASRLIGFATYAKLAFYRSLLIIGHDDKKTRHKRPGFPMLHPSRAQAMAACRFWSILSRKAVVESHG